MNSIFWGLLGVIFTLYIHPSVERCVLHISNKTLIYTDIILVIIIIIDCIVTTIKVQSIDIKLQKLENLES